MRAEKSHHLCPQVAAMSSICCSFCQHPNPADARYCNECGNTLALRPCVNCDAVNDLRAAQCRVCGEYLEEPSTRAYGQGSSTVRPSHTLGDALGAIRSQGLARGAATTLLSRTPTLGSNTRGSCIVAALEPTRDDAPAPSVTAAVDDAAKTPIERPLPGFPGSNEMRARTTPRTLGPILVNSLVIAACVVAFRADQPAPNAQAPINAVLAGAPLSVDAHNVSLPSAHSPANARADEGDVAGNGVESLRSTYGSIANAGESERVTPSAYSVATDALGIKAEATPVPANIDAVARATAADAASPGDAYPTAASRCTEGVAALGLCEPEGKP